MIAQVLVHELADFAAIEKNIGVFSRHFMRKHHPSSFELSDNLQDNLAPRSPLLQHFMGLTYLTQRQHSLDKGFNLTRINERGNLSQLCTDLNPTL